MTNWMYKQTEIKDEDVPVKAVGFIYIITHTSSGKKYLGKKLLTKAATKMVNKKKVKYRKASDWKDYWSSSPYLQELISKEGTANFTREIICFAFSKGELNYMEERSQYLLKVLERDDWINSNIRSRIFKSHVAKYDLKILDAELLKLF